MRKVLQIFSLFILLSSCYHKAPVPEFNMKLVLPADTMVNILTDIQLAEGAIVVQQRNSANISKLSRIYADEVLEKHHVSMAEVEESVRYYSFHIDQMNNIYDKVIARLSIMQNKQDEIIRKSPLKEKKEKET